MTDLKKLSAEDLRDLQAQLNEESKRREEEDRSKTLKFIEQNIEHLLAVVEHSRSSCSDEDGANAYPNSHGTPRCARCALLDFREYKTFYGELDFFDVSVTIRYKAEE